MAGFFGAVCEAAGGECNFARSSSVKASRHDAPSFGLSNDDKAVSDESTRAALKVAAPLKALLLPGWLMPDWLYLGQLPRLHWYQLRLGTARGLAMKQ